VVRELNVASDEAFSVDVGTLDTLGPMRTIMEDRVQRDGSRRG
jgi:hypothetical protein